MSVSSKPGGGWTAGGAVVAAILSSTCCWLPLLLIGLGVSAGGVAGFFEAYRAWLLGGTLILLAAAFYLAYRPQKACAPDGTCTVPNPKLRRLNRILVWVAAAFVPAFATFPNWVHLLVSTEATPITAGIEVVKVKYSVKGMTCQGCESLLEKALAKMPGVQAVKASYKDRSVVISFSKGTIGGDIEVTRAGQEAGYRLRRWAAP